MDIVFIIVMQIALTTKVFAFNFNGFMKNLPLPADLRAMILDMHQKEQEISLMNTNDVTSNDFQSGTPFVAKEPNEMIKPTSTLMKRVVTKMNTHVTQRNILLRSSVTLKPDRSPCMLKMTGKTSEKSSTSVPPFLAMPLPMPIYASVPIMLPMRTYFEKVEHDHPPLHRIKQIIEEDKKKWKEENTESESDISVVIGDSSTDDSSDVDTDSDTDSSSNESVAAPEYYDDVIRINVHGRER